ncbi:MAG: hypothetical protein EXS12_04265 [Phycisphaerales bacterium]|nr:hypothetical protein [Phycisphaerales bacterium]
MLDQDDAPAAHQSLRVLFVVGDSGTAQATALTNALSGLLHGRATFERVSIRNASSMLNSHIHAVVICLSRHDNSSGLTDLLDAVEKRNIPILMLTDAQSAPASQRNSWNLLPISEPPEIIAAMLRGLLSRQSEVDALRNASLGAAKQTDKLLGEVTRMQDELHLAGQVQREFLPKKLPSFSGGTVAALWRPMNYVSGDIYDVRRLDEHHVGLFIADAVGHGVPAALLTMVIARGLPTKEITGKTYRIIQPSEALACVNRELLARQGNTTRFASAIYGIIDLRTRIMRLSIAGHPAAIIMRGNKSMEIVHSSGGLIGVFEGVEWSEQEVQLHAGDRVLLYSDGFEFAFSDPPKKQSSPNEIPPRYMQEFKALLSMNEPVAIIQHMERRLDQQALGAKNADAPADDLTMIVFKVS